MIPKIDQDQVKLLQNKLASAKNILITAHHRPDGDAIGSSLALMHYLKAKGHNCNVMVPDPFPSFLDWLEGTNEVIIYQDDEDAAEKMLRSADLIFCLDYNEPSRVFKMRRSLEESTATKVMIDHHLEPADFCDINFSYNSACSTAEIVYYLIKSMDDVNLIDKKIGEALYTGIMTDTGSFRYESMTADTHEVIAQLLRNGVVNHKVHENVYNDSSEDRTRLIGFATTERLVVLHDKNVAYMWLTKKDLERFNYQPGDTEGIVNIPLAIRGIKLSALFTEGNDIIKISFRSVGDISVQDLASKYFNGGGHKNAAGGRSTLSMDETKTKFEEIIKNLKGL
ncbi:MAG: bifunctional oligoribonuclease/PAP phosphatase NrnA [Bacteroidia bacterium]|nr:bifunctional oligoribonuclease/PAP phosphatase NrnA [Bacteroidia bacterium]